tara:strand:+ start:61 stop:2031 length:1971 start_codon:yes stop_codon:yes gene_type:complete
MAEIKTIIIDVDSKKATKEVESLEKSVDGLNSALDETKKSEGNIEGVGEGAKKSSKGVKFLSKGFKGLGVAMKAAGIGLIISALLGLKEVFSQNQKVVDVFSTAFETFSIVANQVVTAVINVYEAIAKSSENFDALGTIMGNIVTMALTPFKLSFYGIKLGLQVAQLAWEKSFFGSGDTSTINKLNEAINETKDNLKEVAVSHKEAAISIIKNAGEAIGEVANIGKIAGEELGKVSVKAAFETAKANVQLKNSAEIAAAQQSRLVEQYDRQAEQLRQVRDEERNTVAERKEANDKLLEVLAEQESAMLKQADLQVAAAQSELNKNNTIEAQVALIDALANKEGVLAQVEGLRSEQKANDLALDREQIELTNSKGESESRLSIERKRFNAEQIEDELLRLEALKEIDLLEAEQETIRLEAIVENANAETQAKIDAQIALDEFTELSRQTNLTRNTEITEAEAALEEKKTASRKKSLDDLITIGGAESKFGKAMLIAKQLILARELIMDIQGTISAATAARNKSAVKASEAGVDIATGASKAVSAFAPPFNIPIILGYAAQAVGIVSAIKGAMSKSKAATSKFGAAGGGGGGSVSAPSVPSAPSLPPSFNIVGASDTNQLADAVAGQSQAPIQTYVVANDVTTAQSLQNNIVEGATIG